MVSEPRLRNQANSRRKYGLRPRELELPQLALDLEEERLGERGQLAPELEGGGRAQQPLGRQGGATCGVRREAAEGQREARQLLRVRRRRRMVHEAHVAVFQHDLAEADDEGRAAVRRGLGGRGGIAAVRHRRRGAGPEHGAQREAAVRLALDERDGIVHRQPADHELRRPADLDRARLEPPGAEDRALRRTEREVRSPQGARDVEPRPVGDSARDAEVGRGRAGQPRVERQERGIRRQRGAVQADGEVHVQGVEPCCAVDGELSGVGQLGDHLDPAGAGRGRPHVRDGEPQPPERDHPLGVASR